MAKNKNEESQNVVYEESGTLDPAQDLEEPVNELEKALVSYPSDYIDTGSRELDTSTTNAIFESLAGTYNISVGTAYVAVCEMIRRGGHAQGARDTFNVEVYGDGKLTAVSKGEVAKTIYFATKGRRNFRHLAQTLGRSIVRAGIYRLDKHPDSPPLQGDLARTINNRILARGENGLSATEAVGCASYAQHLPELNTLCRSNRLSQLLAEDLELRRKGNRRTGNGKDSGQRTGREKRTRRK
jgi:hypothetical protein